MEKHCESDIWTSCWNYESHYGGKRTGAYLVSKDSLSLMSDEFDDCRFIKELHLEPNRRYLASVICNGSMIESQSGQVGANICMYNTWLYSQEKSLGTFSCQRLTLHFRTDENGIATIALRLGFWCSEAKGRVTFTQFSIEEDDAFVEFGDKLVRIALPLIDLESVDVDKIGTFIDRINNVYIQMSELYGHAPFNGRVISYEVKEDTPFWACAGNPIIWNHKYCLEFFNSPHDDACFGAIHEMGHNFDQTILSKIECEMIVITFVWLLNSIAIAKFAMLLRSSIILFFR